MKVSYTELKDVVENIARKYSRNTQIEAEEFAQELWLWLLECGNGNAIKDIKDAIKICVNRSIDISRRDWNYQRHYARKDWEAEDSQTTTDDVTYSIAGETKLSNRHLDDFEFDTILTKDIVERCEDEKVRKYIVIMGYLNGGLGFLSEMFYEYYKDLSKEKLEQLRNYENKKYTTNMVAQVFFNLNNGSSGTMRSIVGKAKEYLSK